MVTEKSAGFLHALLSKVLSSVSSLPPPTSKRKRTESGPATNATPVKKRRKLDIDTDGHQGGDEDEREESEKTDSSSSSSEDEDEDDSSDGSANTETEGVPVPGTWKAVLQIARSLAPAE
jgi:hypothetical protein